MSTLEIACINPLDRANEIKQLFLGHDRPEFPEFFDRAYPAAVRAGARSWIALDARGRIVMHIARFPHRFAMGEHTVMAGLLVNLLVEKSHRTFLPAAALLRRVIADSKGEEAIDFLYADSVPAAAVVLKAVGFSALGTLERFAFPIRGGRWETDALFRLYQLAVRGRAWAGRFETSEYAAEGFNAEAFERPLGTTPALRPFRPAELYRRRMAGYPSEGDHWFTIHRGNGASSPSGATLIRLFPNHIAKLASLSRHPSLSLSSIIPPLIDKLRRAGYTRLWVSTMLGTEFARELRRVGFVPRNDTAPLLAYSLTARGEAAVRSPSQWEITDLDCDRGDPVPENMLSRAQ